MRRVSSSELPFSLTLNNLQVRYRLRDAKTMMVTEQNKSTHVEKHLAETIYCNHRACWREKTNSKTSHCSFPNREASLELPQEGGRVRVKSNLLHPTLLLCWPSMLKPSLYWSMENLNFWDPTQSCCVACIPTSTWSCLLRRSGTPTSRGRAPGSRSISSSPS